MSVTGSSGRLTDSGKQDHVLVFYADIHQTFIFWGLHEYFSVYLSTAVLQSYVVIVDFNKIHIHWKRSLINEIGISTSYYILY